MLHSLSSLRFQKNHFVVFYIKIIKLVEVESKDGIEASGKYLDEFLSQKGEHITIDNLMEEIHRFY